MTTTEFFTVERIPGGYAVVDFNGESVIGYRDRKTAETLAASYTKGLFTAAESYDIRRTAALAYLAARKERVPAVAAQMELF